MLGMVGFRVDFPVDKIGDILRMVGDTDHGDDASAAASIIVSPIHSDVL